MPAFLIRCSAFLAVVLWLASCANVRYMERLEDYEQEVRRLEARLLKNTSDAEAMQRLGEIYVSTRHYNRANDYLQRAFALDPGNPKTQFYLGLTQEVLGNREAALRLYGKYAEASRLSPYRKLLQGRYRWVSQKVVRDEVRQRLAAEDTLEVDIRRIAVYPLQYQGNEKRYAPLGRGLSDLMTNDMTMLPGLTVVERVRLQELVNEMELGERGYVDPATRPRLGKLLGAGRVVGGTYDVPGSDNLHLNVGLAEWQRDDAFVSKERTDALSRLFDLEKEIVFDLAEQMGIELTPEQRERIDFRPTDNLQAFLAYSRGLEEEDAGNFREAARFYRQASRLDQQFEAAAGKVEEMESLLSVNSAPEDVIGLLQGSPTVDLVDNRIQILNESIGSGIVPGQETRKPAQEPPSVSSGLPDPPPPPAGRGN